MLDPMKAEEFRAAMQQELGQAEVVLSAQQERVLELIVEGLTNREIAERLQLAEKTVKNYVSALLEKLGVRTRTQPAVLRARNPSDEERRSS